MIWFTVLIFWFVVVVVVVGTGVSLGFIAHKLTFARGHRSVAAEQGAGVAGAGFGGFGRRAAGNAGEAEGTKEEGGRLVKADGTNDQCLEDHSTNENRKMIYK